MAGKAAFVTLAIVGACARPGRVQTRSNKTGNTAALILDLIVAVAFRVPLYANYRAKATSTREPQAGGGSLKPLQRLRENPGGLRRCHSAGDQRIRHGRREIRNRNRDTDMGGGIAGAGIAGQCQGELDQRHGEQGGNLPFQLFHAR
jgi:hypothetical protein